jgi:hypothetical protein
VVMGRKRLRGICMCLPETQLIGCVTSECCPLGVSPFLGELSSPSSSSTFSGSSSGGLSLFKGASLPEVSTGARGVVLVVPLERASSFALLFYISSIMDAI